MSTHDNYLDPDRHLWPECPDDVCYHCGYQFPADVEVEDGTPMDQGFCCQECIDDHENKKPIPCIRPMFEFLCEQLGRDDVEGWSKSVYKGTDCGAWLALCGLDQVQLGSIVEGSDVEVGPRCLDWPFTSDAFWGALAAINEEAKFYWDRDNSTDYVVEFSPIGKPPTTHYLHETWGDYEWSEGTPDYVKNKLQHYLEQGGSFECDKPTGIALGITVTEWKNEATYY